MGDQKALPKRIIWAFAVGYFFFYAPYAGTVKLISSRGRNAAEIFPSVVLGTVARHPHADSLGWCATTEWCGAAASRFGNRHGSRGVPPPSLHVRRDLDRAAVLLMRAGVLTSLGGRLAHKRRVRCRLGGAGTGIAGRGLRAGAHR